MNASLEIHRDLRFVINWICISLKVVGLWPYTVDELNWLSKNGFLIVSLLILIVISSPQMISLITVWPDFNLITKNLIFINVPCTAALLKCFIFGFSKQGIRPVVDFIVTDWMRPKIDQERKVILKYATVAKTLFVSFSLVAYATIPLYMTIPLAVLQKAKNISDYADEPFFQTVIVYNIQNSPIFELTCILEIISIILACTAYTVIDGFLTTLVLHLCGQFTNLRNTLKSTINEAPMNNVNLLSCKIGVIVERHIELIRLSRRVQSSFAWTLLMQMLAATIEICFFGFGFIWFYHNAQNNIVEVLFLVAAICTTFIGIYAHCYVSELLCTESEAVGDIAYECCWYNLSPKDARYLLFIMYRSRKPMFLTAGKLCNYSHSLFATILKTSLGYISILMSVREL